MKLLKNTLLKEKNILILIILNSLLLLTMGFLPSSGLLLILDNIFTILFGLEIFYKFKLYKNKFWNDNWNIFDFILVALSIPSLFWFIDFTDLSFLLAFRTVRVFKTFRFFKFVPNIDNLLRSIKRAFKTAGFLLIGFVIYIFITGILSNFLFSSYEDFNNPIISMYSMIKVFTIEGWYEIPEAMIIGMSVTESFFTLLYFVIILLSGGIFGLSIVNATLVDSMTMDNNERLEDKINKLLK